MTTFIQPTNQFSVSRYEFGGYLAPGFQTLLVVKMKPFLKVRRVKCLWLKTCSASSFEASRELLRTPESGGEQIENS